MSPLRRLAVLAIVGSVLLVAFAGVAWAANITCLGGPCTGTEENDRITGSQLDDEIEALGGRDHVTGRMGDDVVDGDAGADEITGGVGGDYLGGDLGPDEIGGGPGTPDGDPRVFYSIVFTDPSGEIDVSCQGNQILEGGGGNDLLTGGRDNELLTGGTGRNTLRATAAATALTYSATRTNG